MTLIVPLPMSPTAARVGTVTSTLNGRLVEKLPRSDTARTPSADVRRDAVDQVVVGADDDGLSRPDVNADVATARQVDSRERWDGSGPGRGDA